MKKEKEIFALCDQVREVSFALHRYLRHGHLEKVYENGLAHRLRRAQLKVEQQYPLKVYDEDGTVLGEYFVDLFVESKLIVESKSTCCPNKISREKSQKSQEGFWYKTKNVFSLS